MTTLPAPLRGIIPPLLTPLSDRDTLDVAGLERLVEHVLAGGVHGLFVLGTTGEGPSLSYKRRCEMIERTCTLVADRVPVLVGVSDTSAVESVQLAEFAADAGARAVVLAAPFYFPAGQRELVRYAEHVAAEMPLPMFLYNMPSHTKLSFAPETVERLMQVHGIVGIKDSSGDMRYFHRLRQLAEARPDWSLLIGPEELLADAVTAGGHGGVCGGANLAPRVYVDLYEAAVRGDRDRLAPLHAQVMRITGSLYTVAEGGARVTKGLKCSLRWLGICDDAMAEPFDRFDDRKRRTIGRRLQALGLLPEGVDAVELRVP